MKPFDLEKALAGEPVVTRDGRPVKIAGYNPHAVEGVRILGWAGKTSRSWYYDGKYTEAENGHDADLFMAEKPKVKKEGWVNLYKSKKGFLFTRFDDSITNVTMGKLRSVLVKSFKIEWEEEAP
jgi:hypothetical protein